LILKSRRDVGEIVVADPVPDHQGADVTDHLEAGHSLDELILTPYDHDPQAEPELDTTPSSNGSAPSSAAYGEKARQNELERLSGAEVGGRHRHLVTSSYRMGRLISNGSLDRDTTVESLVRTGFDIGLEEDEVVRTVLDGVRAGMENPR
jgi:hypothetical protein